MDDNEKVARSTGNVIFFICFVAYAHDRGLLRPEWSRDSRSRRVARFFPSSSTPEVYAQPFKLFDSFVCLLLFPLLIDSRSSS
jgi:hypothetical protein